LLYDAEENNHEYVYHIYKIFRSRLFRKAVCPFVDGNIIDDWRFSVMGNPAGVIRFTAPRGFSAGGLFRDDS
jgi:hypothetical protein